MRRPRLIMKAAALAALLGSSLHAQGTALPDSWTFAPRTEFQTNVAWIYGRPNGALSELGVECTPDGPVVYFADGQVYDGDTRDGRISIVVDGRDFSRPATFVPHGHFAWWRIDPGDGLVDALRSGGSVTLRGDMDDAPFAFRLRGSNAAIGSVLEACGAAGVAGQTAAPAAPTRADLDAGTLRARIGEVCGGAFDADGAIREAQIDGDGRPDFVLDWSRVSCADAAIGRGGGFCGMQMCTLDIYASSVWRPGGWPQPILALSHKLAEPGADHAFRTEASGACAQDGGCTRLWAWTGSKLEVIESAAPAPSAGWGDAPEPVPEDMSGMEPAARDQLAAAGMVPEQWNALVPESAMGFVSAHYFGMDGVSMTLACGPGLPGLGLGVTAPPLSGADPDFGPEDEVWVRLAGEAFRTRFHEDRASGGDRMHLASRWDGQARLLDLLAAGAAVEIVVHPDGSAAAAEVVGTIPGAANHPGYAPVHEVCGDGPEAGGAVQAIPGMIADARSGGWWLRDRTEHFVVPVARSIDTRNGMSFGLHCGEGGTPAGHLNPMLVPEGAPYRVSFRVLGQVFELDGYGDRGSVSFPLTEDFAAAMRAGAEIAWLRDGAAVNVFPTAGIDEAMEFALSSCKPASATDAP